jgi:hypothetical protein
VETATVLEPLAASRAIATGDASGLRDDEPAIASSVPREEAPRSVAGSVGRVVVEPAPDRDPMVEGAASRSV